MFGQTNSIYIVTGNVRPVFFYLGMRQRWRVGLVCKTSGFHLSGFDSHQPHKTFKWSHRLSVRTPGFHPGKRGSIPRGTTKSEILDILSY